MVVMKITNCKRWSPEMVVAENSVWGIVRGWRLVEELTPVMITLNVSDTFTNNKDIIIRPDIELLLDEDKLVQ